MGGGTFGGTGGGTGVTGSSGAGGTHPVFAKDPAVSVVMGVAMVAAGGGKKDPEAGAQERTSPRPRVGTGLKSPLYLAFSA